MGAASGEIGNYGPNINKVASGNKVKTNMPASFYVVVIVVFLVIIVVAAAGVYGCVLHRRRLRREKAANNQELFAPIIMQNGGISKPDALRWTDTNEKRYTMGRTALPTMPAGRY